MKDITRTVIVICSALFLLECQTAAIIVALHYTLLEKPVPQQTGTFIGLGLLYSAGVLGINYGFYKKNGNGGNENGKET